MPASACLRTLNVDFQEVHAAVPQHGDDVFVLHEVLGGGLGRVCGGGAAAWQADADLVVVVPRVGQVLAVIRAIKGVHLAARALRTRNGEIEPSVARRCVLAGAGGRCPCDAERRGGAASVEHSV